MIGEGKVGEIRNSKRKVGDIVVCLWCASTVTIVTN